MINAGFIPNAPARFFAPACLRGLMFVDTLRALGILIAALGLIGCQESDVSSSDPYRTMIGNRYRIVGEVKAYGIYRDDGKKKNLEVVTIIPGVGIQGRLVAFRQPIKRHSTFTIIGARKQPAINFSGAIIKYHVIFDDQQLPAGVEIEIALLRGNESGGVDLNPAIYEKISGINGNGGIIGDRP